MRARSGGHKQGSRERDFAVAERDFARLDRGVRAVRANQPERSFCSGFREGSFDKIALQRSVENAGRRISGKNEVDMRRRVARRTERNLRNLKRIGIEETRHALLGLVKRHSHDKRVAVLRPSAGPGAGKVRRGRAGRETGKRQQRQPNAPWVRHRHPRLSVFSRGFTAPRYSRGRTEARSSRNSAGDIPRRARRAPRARSW